MIYRLCLLAICAMSLHVLGAFNSTYAAVPPLQFTVFLSVALLSAVLLFLPSKGAKANVEDATAKVSQVDATVEVDKVQKLFLHQMLITGGGHIRVLRVPYGWLYSIRFSDWVFVPDVSCVHSVAIRNVLQTTPYLQAEPGVQ